MGGETGPLQRLTDEQVKARLDAYNAGGSLDRDIELLRDNCTDVIAAEVIAQFGPERAERYAQVYMNKVDAGLGTGHRRIWPRNLSRPHTRSRLHRGPHSDRRPHCRQDRREVRKRSRHAPAMLLRIRADEHVRDRHHSCSGRAARSDRSGGSARPGKPRISSAGSPTSCSQHRTIEVADRPDAFHCSVGARHARQDQRGRRRRRAVARWRCARPRRPPPA